MAGLVFLLVFWVVLAGACQGNGVGELLHSAVHHHRDPAWVAGHARERDTHPAAIWVLASAGGYIGENASLSSSRC